MNAILATKGHHHPPDEWEADDADVHAQDAAAEDIRARFDDWDPLRDVSDAFEQWPSRVRRLHQQRSRWQRAWRRRAGRR
jgi:hypothetical protein